MLATPGGSAHHGPVMSKPGAGFAENAPWGLWRKACSFAAHYLANIVFPPSCPVCRELTASHGGICQACWPRLSFIEKPLCPRLGTPFAYDPGPGIVSAAALAKPPVWARARGAVQFDDTARTLVHALKYRDQMGTAALMARLMARAGAALLTDADVLVPVPLNRLRLWQRRFNQSALLARHLEAASGVASRPDLLARTRPTRAQVGLDLAGRRQNVRGAFQVPDELALEITGRTCLLVDDVMTTGATAEACTKALLRAGAGRVDVIVFALVLNPSGRHI